MQLPVHTFASVLSALFVLASIMTVTLGKVRLTAIGALNGQSVLRCSLDVTDQTIDYIFWYIFKSKYDSTIIYYDKQFIWSTNDSTWTPGKYGPFENRSITSRFGWNYHELVIHDSKLSDNKTIFLCAVRMSRTQKEVSSAERALLLHIPSDKESVILEDTKPIVSSNCNNSTPLHQVAAGSINLTCRAGGSMPAPNVNWLIRTGKAKIHHAQTLSYHSDIYGKEVREVTRKIEVQVSSNTTILECTVEEPDPMTGRQRTVHKCLQLVREESITVPERFKHGRREPLMPSLIPFVIVPLVALIIQIVLICCVVNKSLECCKLKTKDEDPPLWSFALVYMVGHTIMGLLGFVVCLGLSKVVGIVVVILIVVRGALKFIFYCIWARKKEQQKGLCATPTKQGAATFIYIAIGCGEFACKEKTEGDERATEEGLMSGHVAAQHQTVRNFQRQKCCGIFATDIILSVAYCVGFLLNTIKEECHIASISVIVLLIVIYTGCATCFIGTSVYCCQPVFHPATKTSSSQSAVHDTSESHSKGDTMNPGDKQNQAPVPKVHSERTEMVAS